MTKKSSCHRALWSLIGVCFLLFIFMPTSPCPAATEGTPALKTSFLNDALSHIRTVGKELGLSSIEFEVRGVSLQVSDLLTHLGPLLPTTILDWNPSGDLTFDLKATATPSLEAGATTLDLDLQLKDLAFSNPDSSKTGDHIEGKLHIVLEIPVQPGRPALVKGEMDLKTGDLHLGDFHLDLEEDPFRVQLSGSYDPENDRLAPLDFHFDTPALGEGRIGAIVENINDPLVEAKLSLGPISNQRALDVIRKAPIEPVSHMLKDASINGETRITASVHGSVRKYTVQGLVEMSAGDLAVPAEEIDASSVEIRLPFAMDFSRLEGSPSPTGVNASIDGFIRARRLRWGDNEWENVSVPLAFAQGALLLGRVKLPMLGGVVAFDGAEIQDPFGKIGVTIRGVKLDRLDFSKLVWGLPLTPKEILVGLKRDQFRLAKVQEDATFHTLPGVWEGTLAEVTISQNRVVTRGNVTVSALGGRVEITNLQSGGGSTSMRMQLTGISFRESPLVGFLPGAIMNYTYSGAAALEIASVKKTDQGQKVKGTRYQIETQNLSFSNPDETILAESVQGQLRLTLFPPAQRGDPLSFEHEMNLDGGEMLIGLYYHNFDEDPLHTRARGSYDTKNSRIPSLIARYEAPTLGELTTKGSIESLDDLRCALEADLNITSNERAFDLFLREPFGRLTSIVEDMSITGQTHLTASIRGSRDRYSIHGVLETSAQEIAIPAFDLQARGLEIQFPFSVRPPEATEYTSGTAVEAPPEGLIEAEWVQWESQRWRDLHIPLTMKDNTLFLPPRLDLPLWQGSVALDQAKIHDPFGKDLEISLGLRMKGLDLAEITGAAGPIAIPGTLDGDFSKINASREKLEADGYLTIRAFGGRISVTAIQGRSPLSGVGDISMEIRLNDLHLEDISRFFKFGQMGGVLEGEINGLTFSYGQPEAFELEIRSVKKTGVKQYVDIEAVNDISILSSGNPLSVTGVAGKLFKYYPYSKLGIYCRLENDVFTVRGTIREGDVEYLIKKSALRGISVINRNPENQIRWKQMLSRLKAVGASMGGQKASKPK